MKHVETQPDFVWEIDWTTSSNVQRARNRHRLLHTDWDATKKLLSRNCADVLILHYFANTYQCKWECTVVYTVQVSAYGFF